MNILDIAIIMLFVSFFFMGFKHGVIREVIHLVGIILVLVVSYYLKDIVGNFLCLHAPFIQFAGMLEGISSFNVLMYQVIAFLLVFSILLSLYAIAVQASIIIQKIVNMTIILLLPSKILGGIVGLLKGCLVIFMILTLLMLPFGNHQFLRDSTLTNKILYETPILSKKLEKFTTSTRDVYEVIQKVSKNKISKEQADLECLDVMLKYKVVSKDTALELLKNGKLKIAADSILAKY